MARPTKLKPLERHIYFYRVVPSTPSSTIDVAALVLQADGLLWTPGTRRYWPQPSGDDVAMWNHDPKGTKFVIASVRRGGFPRSENAGRLTDLTLTTGSGLLEAVHAQLFDHGIIGFEFNFYGPRPSRLPLYLKHALPFSPDFSLEALLRNDVLTRLDEQKELRVIDLQIRRGYADKVAKANKKLGDALTQLGDASAAEVIGITLRPEPRARKSLGAKALGRVKKIAKLDGIRENAVVFKVKGVNANTGKVDPLDLLSDHLVSRQSIVRQSRTNNAVDSASAFAAIQAAHAELKDELLDASGVQPKSDGGSNGTSAP